MTKEFALKFAGVFLGVLARTLVPWIRKLKEGPAARFDRRYAYSTLGSLAVGFILTLVIFPQLTVPGGEPGFEAYFKLFCLAFGFGFGWNGIVLEGGQWTKPALAAAGPGSRRSRDAGQAPGGSPESREEGAGRRG